MKLQGKDLTVLTALAKQATPVRVGHLARTAWARKRRLQRKARLVLSTLRRMKKAGLVKWIYDPQWMGYGWFCTDVGREAAGY